MLENPLRGWCSHPYPYLSLFLYFVKHIRKPWKLINLISCSVRVTQDNGAPAGRGGAPTRASHSQLYGGGRPPANCGVVQEREAGRVRLSADDSASRRTLLLEGRHNKYVIYPATDHFDVKLLFWDTHPPDHLLPCLMTGLVVGMFLLPKRAKSGNNISSQWGRRVF